MVKKSRIIGSVGVFIAFLFIAILFFPSPDAAAKTEVVAIDGISYNVNFFS